MSENPLVPPPAESGAPAEQGLPASTLSGSGPQDAVAPGTHAGGTGATDDATLMAPDGDPGGTASDPSAGSDTASLGADASGANASSDPMPDPGGTARA